MENLYKLIEKHKNKDNSAFLEILERFEPLINSLHKKGIYEDMKNDLTIFLFELLNRIPIQKNIFREDKYVISYISKSLNNQYINLNKKYHKKDSKELSLEESYFNFGNDSNFSKIFFDDIVKNLEKLENDILIKRYKFGYSDKEIAEEKGISRQTVHKTRIRALNKLKKSLFI